MGSTHSVFLFYSDTPQNSFGREGVGQFLQKKEKLAKNQFFKMGNCGESEIKSYAIYPQSVGLVCWYVRCFVSSRSPSVLLLLSSSDSFFAFPLPIEKKNGFLKSLLRVLKSNYSQPPLLLLTIHGSHHLSSTVFHFLNVLNRYIVVCGLELYPQLNKSKMVAVDSLLENLFKKKK